MDIRIPVIAAFTLLISLSEGSSRPRSVSILDMYNPCLIFLHSLNFFHIKQLRWSPRKPDMSAMIHQYMALAQK